MNKNASAGLNARLNADGTGKKNSRSTSDKTIYLTSYPQVVNFLPKTYAADKVIAETEPDIKGFLQPSNITPSQYVKELMTETLWCGDVYEKYALNKILIEGLDASIRQSMREQRRNMKDANLHVLAFHVVSLLRMQGRDVTSKRTNPIESKSENQR